MSETKEVAGRLNAFAGITPDHPSGASYINHSARQLVREAAREIERLQSDLTRYIDIATKEATEAEGLRAERDAADAQMAAQNRILSQVWDILDRSKGENLIERVSTLTRQLEEAREVCAKVAETVVDTKDDGIDAFDASQIIAAAIRSLKQGERD
jgi:hypothetical protein